MANDIFAPQIGGAQVSALASPVATPVTEVRDNSAATLANTLGNAMRAFGDSKKQANDERVAAVEGGFAQQLADLADARARGEITTSQYRTRGARLYKDYADATPALAPDLAKQFNTVTGLNVGEFASQKTPEELAQEQYIQDRTQLALELGVSEREAGGVIRNQRTRAIRKDQLALKVAERENAGAAFVQLGAVYAADYTDAVAMELSRVYEGGGELTPTQVSDLKNRARSYATQVKQQVLKTSGNVDTRSMQEFDDQMEGMIRRLDSMANNRSEYEFYKQTSTIMEDQADIYLQENYGSALKLKTLLGDKVYEATLIELKNMGQGNSALLTALQQDPIMGVVTQEMRNNPDLFGQKFLRGFDKLTGGDPQDPTQRVAPDEAAAVGVMLNTSKGYEIAKQMFDGESPTAAYKVYANAPSTVVHWTRPRFKTAVANGEFKESDIQTAIEGTMQWAVTDALSETQTNIGATLTITRPVDELDEDVRGRGDIRGVPEVIFSGDGVTQEGRQALRDAYRVAKEYPQLWERNFDNPAQYLQSIFDTKFGVGARR